MSTPACTNEFECKQGGMVVAVCCSVLQCAAVCCSVLQCVAEGEMACTGDPHSKISWHGCIIY